MVTGKLALSSIKHVHDISVISGSRGINSSRGRGNPGSRVYLEAEFYGCRCIPGSKRNSGSNASSISGVIPSSTVSLVVEIVMVAVIGVGTYHVI